MSKELTNMSNKLLIINPKVSRSNKRIQCSFKLQNILDNDNINCLVYEGGKVGEKEYTRKVYSGKRKRKSKKLKIKITKEIVV